MKTMVKIENARIDKEALLSEARPRIGVLRELQKLGLVPLDGDHMPVIVYPPFPNFTPASVETVFKDFTPNPDATHSIYLAFPFCKAKCTFCHLPITTSASEDQMERYVAAFEREMDLLRERLGVDKIKTRDILVGGGTPTYCSPKLLDKYFKILVSRLDMASCTQFNIDLDPLTLLGSVGKERMRIMKSYGVDRLTMGVQSLHDDLLKHFNRTHDAEQAASAAALIKQEGFALDIEFIYGYPAHSMDQWIGDMEKAIDLAVDEIQVYRMRYIPYEGGLPNSLSRRFDNKEVGWEIEKTMLMKEVSRLMLTKAGYEETLSRVFRKKSDVYSHYAINLCCDQENLFGIGPAAYGRYEDRATLNTRDIKEYYASLEAGRLPLLGGVRLDRLDNLHRYISNSIKGYGGKVFKKVYQRQTGVSLNDVFRKKIEALKTHGLLYENDQEVGMTEVGRFFADEVATQFLPTKYLPFPRSAYADGPLNPHVDNVPFP